MIESRPQQLTPLTPKADRADRNVRLFEEAVLRLRGRFPATATGLCFDANRAFGLGSGHRDERRRAIETHADEALRLVEALYGRDTADEIRRSAG